MLFLLKAWPQIAEQLPACGFPVSCPGIPAWAARSAARVCSLESYEGHFQKWHFCSLILIFLFFQLLFFWEFCDQHKWIKISTVHKNPLTSIKLVNALLMTHRVFLFHVTTAVPAVTTSNIDKQNTMLYIQRYSTPIVFSSMTAYFKSWFNWFNVIVYFFVPFVFAPSKWKTRFTVVSKQSLSC